MSRDPNSSLEIETVFHQLVSAAVKEIAGELRTSPDPPNSPREVFMDQADGGYGSAMVDVPSYGHSKDAIWKATEQPASSRLLEFIWENRHSLWPQADTGSEFLSDETAFRMNVAGWTLVTPMLFALVDSTSRQLAEDGAVVPHLLTEAEINAIIEEIVQAETDRRNGTKRVTAHVLVSKIDIDQGSLELFPGITIHHLEGFERRYHHTRNSRWWIGHEFSLFPSDYMLEINTSIPARDYSPEQWIESLQEPVLFLLDVVKWALTIATSQRQVVQEQTVVIRQSRNYPSTVAHRESVSPVSSYRMSHHVLSKSQALDASELIQKCLDTADAIPEIRNLIWYFGRSCVASNHRDALLDAAIGMDSVLSTAGPNATYKFELHGEALLSSYSNPKHGSIASMKQIYQWRSKIAHGSAKSVNEDWATQTRFTFACIIEGLLSLLKSGAIKPPGRNERLANCVQAMVRNRVSDPKWRIPCD